MCATDGMFNVLTPCSIVSDYLKNWIIILLLLLLHNNDAVVVKSDDEDDDDDNTNNNAALQTKQPVCNSDRNFLILIV